jgi:outer membrane protein
MKSKKIAIGLFVGMFLVFWMAGNLSAQGLKIGYIQDERIYSEYPAWTKAQEDWELERKVWDDEAAEKQNALQELTTEYEKQKLILSDEKKKEREMQISLKEQELDEFTRRIYGPGGTAEKKQELLIQPLLSNIHKAIETLAVENNYDVIFTLQGIGYIKDIYDVTDKVLELLNELEQ